MNSSLPEVVEQILRPVRAALGAGESLHRYCARVGVSYSALYNLLHGRGTPRYDTLLRLHAALARPVVPSVPLVPEPILYARAEPWMGRRACELRDLTRFSVVWADPGGGVTTALSLLDFLRDPLGGALWRAERSGGRVSAARVEARTDTIAVVSSVTPHVRGPCAGAVQVTYEVTRTLQPVQMVHAQEGWVWPGTTYAQPSGTTLVDVGSARTPVDEVAMREVVQQESARDLLRVVGAPCDGRLPRGDQAHLVAHLLVALHRGGDLLLVDCVDALLGERAFLLVVKAISCAVATGHLGQAVVGTHRRSAVSCAEDAGANNLYLHRDQTITSALQARA